MGLRGHNIIIAFFLGVSSVKRVILQRCLVFDLWNKWKNLMPIDKKVKKKNQIPKYHVPRLKGYNED